MMTLYKYPFESRAERVLWTLEELNFEYEVIDLNLMTGESRTPEFLALNPHAKVPTLVHDGKSFTESLAIMEYLNDLHPEHPLTINPDDDNYAQKNYQLRQALSYGLTEVESYCWLRAQSTILKGIYHWPEGTAEQSLKSMEKAVATVWQWLDERDYIAGDTFTLVDIYYYQLIDWMKKAGVQTIPQHVTDYLHKLTLRPNFPDAMTKKSPSRKGTSG